MTDRRAQSGLGPESISGTARELIGCQDQLAWRPFLGVKSLRGTRGVAAELAANKELPLLMAGYLQL